MDGGRALGGGEHDKPLRVFRVRVDGEEADVGRAGGRVGAVSGQVPVEEPAHVLEGQGRCDAGAQVVVAGAAEEALRGAVEYAKIRKVFGKPLAKFEGIQFRIADDFSLLEASKLVCYKALYLIERKVEGASIWAAMANLMGGEAAFKAVNDAMDVFGGLGYSKELPVERYLRDIKGVQLANATLKFEIGRGIFGEGFFPYA